MDLTFKFYNTLSRKVEAFVPLDPEKKKVTMYNCGPTVYGFLHIGNARNTVVFDALRRVLSRQYQVTYVRNITDVDDKIIDRARDEKTTWQAIAETYLEAYEEDTAKLGVLYPDLQPRATEYIPQMIKVIERLMTANLAYAVEGSVYYRVAARADYGKLSGRKLDELQAGARVEVEETKDDPMDFALWKSAKSHKTRDQDPDAPKAPDEPSWPSPWGPGRPGWHIECSAMALELLGETFDIHTGGQDLIFPHHENEIAQSEGTTGKPFARYWLHNGMLEFQGGKMSKSVGNVVSLRETLAAFDPVVIRYFLLSAHYRSPQDYGPQSLPSAKAAYEELVNTFSRLKELCGQKPVAGHLNPMSAEFVRGVRVKFWDALTNDFNTPEAFGHLFALARQAKRTIADPQFVLTQPTQMSLQAALNLLYEGLAVLNLAPTLGDVPASAMELLQQREDARKRKEFAAADQIRAKLLAQGIHVEDTPAGPIPILKKT